MTNQQNSVISIVDLVCHQNQQRNPSPRPLRETTLRQVLPIISLDRMEFPTGQTPLGIESIGSRADTMRMRPQSFQAGEDRLAKVQAVLRDVLGICDELDDGDLFDK